MYRNEFDVVPYALRSTPSGTLVGTAGVIQEAGDHNELYLFVGRASAFPSYSDRGPTLNVRVELPAAKFKAWETNIPGVTATSFAIDFGAEPSTAKGYWVDILPWALGRIAVTADLAEGVGGATARATYAITVVGRGYH
jgi:hypothetical protein